MRMRKKKYLDERLAACESVSLGWLQDYASEMRGENAPKILDTMEVFGNNNPVHLEIGCGKGQFADEIARRNPDINFIAIEQNANVIVSAMERTLKNGTPNLRYLMGMAEYLEKMFPPKSVEKIYLNFSCPFPKGTYAKHRLTHKVFLDIYKNILVDDGVVVQKTDNKMLFEFSLDSFSENGFMLKNVSLDLHNSKIKGNIITEYEEKFSSQGFPIYYVEAVNKKWGDK